MARQAPARRKQDSTATRRERPHRLQEKSSPTQPHSLRVTFRSSNDPRTGQAMSCQQKGSSNSSKLVENESTRNARVEEITEALEMEHDDKAVRSASSAPEIFSDIACGSQQAAFALRAYQPQTCLGRVRACMYV